MPNGSQHLTITNPLVLYRSLIATQKIKPDPAQHRFALHLQKLYERLIDYEPSVEYSQRLQQISRAVGTHQHGPPNQDLPTSEWRREKRVASGGTRGLWRNLLQRKEQRDSLALTRVLTSYEAAMQLQSPKGLMLHGDVGTGKSMLIDLFADCLPNRKKRRYHFSTFMLHTISQLETLRTSRSVRSEEYSLLWLAKDLVEKSPILFLDEFQLPDRVASKILSHLMTSFFQLGGVLIATSNRMPEELAKAAGMEFDRPVSRLSRLGWNLGLGSGGVAGRRDDGPGQLGEFGVFLEVLRARCEVWEMEGKKDYRRLSGDREAVRTAASEEMDSTTSETDLILPFATPSSTLTLQEALAATPDSTSSIPKFYFVKPSPNPTELAEAISTATSSPHPIPWTSATLIVYGRKIPIPRQHDGTALFTFAELCGATLGPADYITLASTYHTFVLTDVPILSFLQKNEARRLITLLDALYEARCRLLVTATAGPDDILFPEPPVSKKTSAGEGEEGSNSDAIYSETYSEIHQDLTSPFRPNVSAYSPSLPVDALEDDPPNRYRKPGTSYTDERKLSDGSAAPDFSNVGGLTGEDERFAVKRAQSRLWEMCSARWWTRTSSSSASDTSWWRPLPQESRHWERSSTTPPTFGPTTSNPLSPQLPPNTAQLKPLGNDVQLVNEQVVDEDWREQMFKDGASPFRTSPEPPPKFGLEHVWGTVKWGKRAGAWGKGAEGLAERGNDKGDGDGKSDGKSDGKG
ncbi:AFG1-like ATPase-domain-containing protein [Lophiotrema nucula]|uniref:AFG1-like ATPase-domain-containing protein n=1 Tax=Lophiotrema nucula TaxID=690887 RepID=A0A6A5ZF94_9PLEO|nr:AFG1-like ATPase-domain-containing protein [Lophiotrema nucula]